MSRFNTAVSLTHRGTHWTIEVKKKQINKGTPKVDKAKKYQLKKRFKIVSEWQLKMISTQHSNNNGKN